MNNLIISETESTQSPETAVKAGSGRRPVRVRRFLAGLLLSTSGIASILIVASSTLRLHQLGKEIALPIVAAGVLLGILLLGGGFGVMAAAAGSCDESEFDRLMNADGNQAA